MIYDAIIIGKGPAGITAGIYLKRANFNVLIIGKDGGALEKANAIDNYYGFANTISGKELLQEGLAQANRLEIQIDTDEVVSIRKEDKFIVETRNNTYKACSVILATGTNRNTPNIKGIKEFEGRGVSYCATCDAFFYRNKNVGVIGAGDYALKEAQELLRVANQVTIFTNGEKIVENRSISLDEFNIEENKVEAIIGNEKIENIKLNEEKNISLDGVFIAIRYCI